MGEVARIQDQLRRAVHGDAWHGPGLLDTLKDVTADRASARVVPRAHSIWEIAMHIDVWLNVVRRRTLGEAYEPTPAQDWPAASDGRADAWPAVLEALAGSHDELQRAISGLSEPDLERAVPGRSYDVYTMLHGVIQHTLYHCGQIAVLKK